MKSSVRSLLCGFVLVCGTLVATSSIQAGAPLWTLMVPAPTAVSSAASTLTSVTSDGRGNALVVINVTNASTAAVGVQLFLVNPKGKLLGQLEVATSAAIPLLVSARRVIVQVDFGLVQLTPDGNGALVLGNLSIEEQQERLLLSNPTNYDFKFLHSSLSPLGFVTKVKRYGVSRLSPLPN